MPEEAKEAIEEIKLCQLQDIVDMAKGILSTPPSTLDGEKGISKEDFDKMNEGIKGGKTD